MTPNPAVLFARAALFAALAVWIAFGPFYRQILGGRGELFRPWVMFSGAGLTATQVRYFEAAPSGELVVLDRYAMLAPGKEPPRSLQYVKDEAAAKRIATKLCHELGEGADVRASFRVATRAGWKRVLKTKENLCAAP